MSNTSAVMKEALEHAQTELQNYKKLSVVPTPELPEGQLCAPGDTACNARMIQAFADCGE